MLKKNNLFISKIIENYKKNPNKIIISDKKKSYSYSQLFKLSINFSHKIKNLNSNIIPIIVDRNVETVVAILAVIFSKKIFCPISSNFPIKRIDYYLKRLNTDNIVNCSAKKFNFNNEIKLKNIFKIKKYDKNNSFDFSDISETFYLLFTSGSTGHPKGVKLSYKNILNTILWSKYYIKWSKHKIGIATQFSFDISMFDLFSGFYFNVPMFIFSNPSDPFLTLKEIRKYNVTSIFSVPAFFSNFVNYKLINKKYNKLKRIISGGDFFYNKDIISWKNNQPKIDVFNVWGPTETSIVNTMYKIKKKDLKILSKGKSIPVGKSHKMMELRIMKNKKIVKENNIGEICMFGSCVSQGYIGDSKNSKKYFRFRNKRGYYTGDLGYLDRRGYLHIVGRKDNTIKISGYRVDTKEIENMINLKFKFKNTCLLKSKYQNNDILSLVIEADKKKNADKILRFLKENFPFYSIPKKILFLKKFPLNQNSKIDRNKIKTLIDER